MTQFTSQLVQPSGIAPSLPLRRDSDVALEAHGFGAFRALALVLMLIALSAWLLRRKWLGRRSGAPSKAPDWLKWLDAPAKAGGLRVVESRRLTPRASLHVLHWGGEEWLVGCTEQGMTVLGKRDLPSGEPSEAAATDPFREGL